MKRQEHHFLTSLATLGGYGFLTYFFFKNSTNRGFTLAEFVKCGTWSLPFIE
ncbi:MAG: hypothetical protein ACFE9L_12175 [Candidatus Hodarchaeota archaeon]